MTKPVSKTNFVLEFSVFTYGDSTETLFCTEATVTVWSFCSFIENKLALFSQIFSSEPGFPRFLKTLFLNVWFN